jgi:hypothetical protein
MADRQEQRQGQKGPQRKPDRLVSFEELQWFDCRVERVGPGEDGTIWVNLTDTGARSSGSGSSPSTPSPSSSSTRPWSPSRAASSARSP